MDLAGRSLLRRWMPRRTVRLRLTLLYGGLFLLAGAVLLTITYELVSHSPAATAKSGNVFVSQAFDGGASAKLKLPPPPNGVIEAVRAQGQTVGAPGQTIGAQRQIVGAQGQPVGAQGQPVGGQRSVKGGPIALSTYAGNVNRVFKQLTAAASKRLHQVTARAEVQLRTQQSAQLGTLLTRSAIALGIMAVVSIGLGWLISGRALRPVRTMSARARGISERNLHERLGLDGPNDELKELGDTFDELLGRLEAAFESQRQFVANASHELRTPLTLERALVEVALADPDATTDSLRAACERVLVASENQERLIEALLTLARSQRGLESRQQLDLADVAAEALRGVLPSGTRVESDLEGALTAGDPALVERLVGNLIDNALRYNLEQDGWVSVWTGISDGRPTLRVGNSGPVVSRDEVAILTEPFRRLNGSRTETRGTGLGLSIVAAIASAHGAALRTTPRPDGGLDVEVAFSAVAAPSERGVAQATAAHPE